MTERARKFMDPHDVPPIPGTEGWERMYPYYYQFVPKGTDPIMERYEDSQMWFVDGMHQTAPLLPFETYPDDYWWPSLSQISTRVFCFPTSRGIDHRMLNGWVYLTSLEEEDSAVIEQKAKVVEKRLNYYYQHWDEFLKLWTKKQYENSKKVDELRFGDLPEIVDDAYILNHIGFSPASEMRRDYWKLLQVMDLWLEYHFELFNIGLGAFLTFTEFCKKAFPGITDVTIGRMCAGVQYDSRLPQVKLQELAKLAIDLGVANAILEPGDADQVEARLSKIEAGRKWQGERDKLRDPWFYIGTGYSVVTHEDRSWNDDWNLPLPILRGYIEKLQRSEPVAEDVESRKREADTLAQGYRRLLKADEDKAIFDNLLSLGRKALEHSESHMFWGEAQLQYRMYNKLRELGKVFCKYEMLDDPDDLYYLNRYEIPQLIHDLTIAWAHRTRPRSTWYWRPEIKWRKQIYARFKEWVPITFLGVAPDVITEPFTIGLWGIVKESINAYLTKAEVKVEE